MRLIVTKPPEGKIVHTKYGIKANENYLAPYFKLLVACGILQDSDQALSNKSLLNPQYIPATAVGLEWHENGKKT